MRRVSMLLGALFVLSSTMTCGRERPSRDPDLTLLEIGKAICAAPGEMLRHYAKRPSTFSSRDVYHLFPPDPVLARAESSLAALSRSGHLFDDSALVATLAAENRPALYGSVSTQRLASDAPFPNVGWIDLFFGPVIADTTKPWGRGGAPGADTLFLMIRIFLVDVAAWGMDAPRYHAALLPSHVVEGGVRQGRGCEAMQAVVVHETAR